MDAYIIHDGATISEVSQDFCDLFRCASDQVIGKRVEEIIFGRDLRQLAVVRGKWIMKFDSDQEFVQQYDFIRCDDTSFWGEAHSKRLTEGQYRTWIVWKYDTDEW